MTPTIEDVLKKYGFRNEPEIVTVWLNNYYEGARSAMTEWEQITSAPLLKRIEELEKENNWMKLMLSKSINK